MKPPKKLIKSENIRLRECVLTFDGAHTPKSGLLKTKTCAKCREVKALDEFHKEHRSKDGTTQRCKLCRKIDAHKYYEANTEQCLYRTKKWYKENPERYRARKREWYKENPEKVRAMRRRTYYRVETRKRFLAKLRQSRDELDNNYIRKLCTNGSILSIEDIPQELIDVKREHIKLKRLMKGHKNEDNQGSKRKIG